MLGILQLRLVLIWVSIEVLVDCVHRILPSGALLLVRLSKWITTENVDDGCVDDVDLDLWHFRVIVILALGLWSHQLVHAGIFSMGEHLFTDMLLLRWLV